MAVAAPSGLGERRRQIWLKAEYEQCIGRAVRPCAVVPTGQVLGLVDIAVSVGDRAAVPSEDEPERWAMGARETHCLVASVEAVERGTLDKHEFSLKSDCKGMQIIA